MSRPRCADCERPLVNCLCPWVTPHDNRVEVIILQHPQEVRAAKNTAGLLHLSLAHSHLEVGETFATETLSELITSDRINLLLYPETPDPKLPAPPDLELGQHKPEQLRLIVLDGTWRKSRKMLYLNPTLQALPRLALTDTPASNYRIRKASKPGQLSTLEASCYALGQLEGKNPGYRSLLAAFDAYIDHQLARIPERSGATEPPIPNPK